ncbi:hypothetical protein E5K00_01860 [Hymenobacter aquaticus]|uniref:Uncharacterized protein n=1 Tax=Hymenobacter aquaticus TaxID=1867101 RepID=A0A4Z0Q2S0_9BACT|nr:hypothetical protein [Hymenobacter aquaticus]TGE23985.1 hypothetical protein E5K00_01860 [Hymenobacter aquaticus]
MTVIYFFQFPFFMKTAVKFSGSKIKNLLSREQMKGLVAGDGGCGSCSGFGCYSGGGTCYCLMRGSGTGASMCS